MVAIISFSWNLQAWQECVIGWRWRHVPGINKEAREVSDKE